MVNSDFTTFGPVAAYSNPLPLPSVDPDASVTQCVEFNASYLPYILGALAPLLLPEAWDTDDVNEKLLAMARIDHLRYLLMNPELCTSSSLCLTLAQIMTDAEGNLALFVAGLLAAVLESCGEFLKEQLESIISLDAIMNFFFGSSADMAEFASVLPEYGVEAVLPQYRLNGCAFEVSFDDGETWVPQFEFSLEECAALAGPQGPQGPQGVEGAPGTQGNPGTPGTGAQITPEVISDLPKICSGAQGILDWSAQLLEAGLSKIDESAAAFAVASAIMAETIIGDIVLNDLLATIAAFEVLGTSAIRAAHGPSQEVTVKCEFYCAFKALTAEVTETDVLDVAGTLAANENIWIAALGSLMLTSGGKEFLAAYISAATNEDNSCVTDCTSCPEEWCHLYDFTVDNQGWTLEYTTQRDSGGLHDSGSGTDAVYIKHDPYASHITDITFTLNAPFSGTAPRVYIQTASHLTTYLSVDGAQDAVFTLHVNQDVVSLGIVLDRYAGNVQYWGTLRLQSIEIRGTGDDPEEGYPCA